MGNSASLFSRGLDELDYLFYFRRKFCHLKSINNRKNVLFLTPLIVVGGAELLNLSIASEIDKEKYALHLLTTDPARNELRGQFENYFENVITPRDRTAKIVYLKPIDLKRLNYLIKKLKVQLILLNGYSGYKFVSDLKRMHKRIIFVDIIHNETNPGSDKLVKSAEIVDRRICISARVKNYVIDLYNENGIDQRYAERLLLIYNGVDTREFSTDSHPRGKFKIRYHISENTRIISFVGRISREKNPILFLEIAKEILKRSDIQLKFVIAGDGPEIGKVQKYIKDNKLDRYFLLTGTIYNVAELLSDTFLLLVVSKREGMPLSILEAMSMGVPVISTDVGAINEVIEDHWNGFLINPGKELVISFTNKILEFLNGHLDYSSFSERAMKRIFSEFSLDIMGSMYERIFDELAEDNERELKP